MGNDGVSFSQLKMTNPSVLPILRKTDVIFKFQTRSSYSSNTLGNKL